MDSLGLMLMQQVALSVEVVKVGQVVHVEVPGSPKEPDEQDATEVEGA